jgi:Zn-dependent M28 family amino/carboxypeptidase
MMKSASKQWAKQNWSFVFAIAIFILGLISAPYLDSNPQTEDSFDGERAYQDVLAQMAFGPRTPGSVGHTAVVSYIQDELSAAGWQAELQPFTISGHDGVNVIGKFGQGQPWIVLGAHFDARMQADQDQNPDLRNEPVPAANDGASGVAVLLELARTLPKDFNGQIWLVFFDLEDQGDIPGYDWILGSRAFVANLTGKPDAAIIVDMIGDADLNIYQERNSDKDLTEQIWSAAQSLGYQSAFLEQSKYSMLDDHTPFLEAGIPAVDIIDFDYPYWHTIADTADKVSAESLKTVGETLRNWLKFYD